MPRPPSEIIVNAEPVKDSIYNQSNVETPIYIADLRPDMNRSSGLGNIQNLRYNKVDDRYYSHRDSDDECDDYNCCESDTLCIICFCCGLCD